MHTRPPRLALLMAALCAWPLAELADARAQNAPQEDAYPSFDFSKPVFTKPGYPICVSEAKLEDFYTVMEATGAAPAANESCVASLDGEPVVILESHGFLVPIGRVRLLGLGTEVDGWLRLSALRN